jgi:hypothetical protein
MAGACIDTISDVEVSRLVFIAGEETIYSARPARGMRDDRLICSIVVTGLGPVAPGCGRIAVGRGDTSMATLNVDCPPSYETPLPRNQYGDINSAKVARNVEVETNP